MTVGQRANLGDKKMADFLKQILSTLFQEKPIKIVMVGKLFERSFIWVVSVNSNSNGLEARAIWTWLLLFSSDIMSRMGAKT